MFGVLFFAPHAQHGEDGTGAAGEWSVEMGSAEEVPKNCRTELGRHPQHRLDRDRYGAELCGSVARGDQRARAAQTGSPSRGSPVRAAGGEQNARVQRANRNQYTTPLDPGTKNALAVHWVYSFDALETLLRMMNETFFFSATLIRAVHSFAPTHPHTHPHTHHSPPQICTSGIGSGRGRDQG